jgi:hypothetical protein
LISYLYSGKRHTCISLVSCSIKSEEIKSSEDVIIKFDTTGE